MHTCHVLCLCIVLAVFAEHITGNPITTVGMNLRTSVKSTSESLKKSLECSICKKLGGKVFPEFNAHKSIIEAFIRGVCYEISGDGECSKKTPDGDWSCSDLCKGIIIEEGQVISNLMKTGVPPVKACRAIGLCGTSPDAGSIPPEPFIKSNITDQRGQKNWPNWENWKKGSRVGTFVHFTDLHIQLNYKLGTEVNCGEPLCCREQDGPAKDGKGALQYGSDNCDMPTVVFDKMLEAIRGITPTPDFIINTGDDPSHFIWDQTQKSNIDAITYVTDAVARNGPANRPYISLLGNHENAPVNQYQGPDDSLKTLKFGGFYQTKLAPGLRGIALHSTMFTFDNWYFRANQTDYISGQFPWLRDVLQQARDAEEKVLLLRHHPIDSLDAGFNQLLRKCLEDFSDILIGSLAGHSHTTWYTVLRDRATGKIPLQVEYITGGDQSVALNPTFRVFHYNKDTFEILDFDQYFLDVDKANNSTNVLNNSTTRVNQTALHNEYVPSFVKAYSARNYFNITDLSPNSWNKLAVSWLDGNDNLVSWKRYSAAMSRFKPYNNSTNRAPNRMRQACISLSAWSDDVHTYPKCHEKFSWNSNASLDHVKMWQLPELSTLPVGYSMQTSHVDL